MGLVQNCKPINGFARNFVVVLFQGEKEKKEKSRPHQLSYKTQKKAMSSPLDCF